MRLKNVSVLVVEDDAETREVMEAVFRSEGATVRSAGTARAALALLRTRWKPNVLVSDLALPEESGCSMMRAIRRMGIRTPAVALTGSSGETSETFGAGFQLHISKPLAHENLVLIIQRLGCG